MTAFVDGTGWTPGTEGCRCPPDCEHPCWMRIGIAPPCEVHGCPDFDTDDDLEDTAA